MGGAVTLGVFAVLLTSSYSAKILGVFPTAVPSHHILENALLRGLAEAGHDVTVISPFVEKNPPKGGRWRNVELTGFIEHHRENTMKSLNLSTRTMNSINQLIERPRQIYELTENTLNHPNVQKFINSDEHFDVVILGQFMFDALKGFSAHFNAHQIILSTLGPNFMTNPLVGNPSLPSYAPEVISTFPPRMNFRQRLMNTFMGLLFTGFHRLVIYPGQRDLTKKYFPMPIDLDDVMYNVSLLLLNSHVGINSPLPYVPCMIDIGGFHIKPPGKLPEHLQSFLDEAEDGVIYFSMGSNLQSKDLPVEKRNAILKSFGKLKQKVLWKFEDEVLPGQPPNVKIGKWLPQQEILAHRNVKVFITHGGLLSTTETLYRGVPVIAIPIFGDQSKNAEAARIGGYGIVLPFNEITEESFSSALEEMLTNSKYRNEAVRRSLILNDRQVKPLDSAIYWVEYVIRHNGAKHLRVPYLDLTWYQYYLLDVLALILSVIVGVYFILRKLVCSCKKYVRRTKLKQN